MELVFIFITGLFEYECLIYMDLRSVNERGCNPYICAWTLNFLNLISQFESISSHFSMSWMVDQLVYCIFKLCISSCLNFVCLLSIAKLFECLCHLYLWPHFLLGMEIQSSVDETINTKVEVIDDDSLEESYNEATMIGKVSIRDTSKYRVISWCSEIIMAIYL